MGRCEKAKNLSSKRPRILEPSRRPRTLDSSKRSRPSDSSKFPKILEATKRSSIMEMMKGPEESENNKNVVTYFDKFDGELWEMCPLDKLHYAKRKNMKQHLIECKKQFLKSSKKVECPFNPLHIINRMEVEEHLLTCENRVTIFSSGIDFEPKRELIEGVPAAPLNTVPTFDNYWDEEPPTEGTYDPIDRTKFLPQLRQTPPGLSRTQKKAFREKERLRHKHLTGETKEKPRGSPYPMWDQVKAEKVNVKTEAAIKEEENIMDSIIQGMNSAKIGDPRNSIVKQINSRLKKLQFMKIKIREEEIALQRQVEEYLASTGKNDDQGNRDPRLSGQQVIANITATIAPNVDPLIANLDLGSIGLPNIMSNAMHL